MEGHPCCLRLACGCSGDAECARCRDVPALTDTCVACEAADTTCPGVLARRAAAPLGALGLCRLALADRLIACARSDAERETGVPFVLRTAVERPLEERVGCAKRGTPLPGSPAPSIRHLRIACAPNKRQGNAAQSPRACRFAQYMCSAQRALPTRCAGLCSAAQQRSIHT